MAMSNSEKMQWLIDNHKEAVDDAISVRIGMPDSVQMDAESYWKHFSEYVSASNKHDEDYIYHEKYINHIRFFCLTARRR